RVLFRSSKNVTPFAPDSLRYLKLIKNQQAPKRENCRLSVHPVGSRSRFPESVTLGFQRMWKLTGLILIFLSGYNFLAERTVYPWASRVSTSDWSSKAWTCGLME